ncbi:MAG: von Willebrand factor type A domain-containing protein, partial [Lachnospiraceae bacterium]|nr:von Willebrand factor type A domain-containing protein [Lachnospiraceae bacterium]
SPQTQTGTGTEASAKGQEAQGSATAQTPGDEKSSGTAASADHQETAQAGVSSAPQEISPTGSSSAPQEISATSATTEKLQAEPKETLEQVIKNHDSFTDDLSRWNAKAQQRGRSAWNSNLTPSQEQEIIDSMNGNFKRAVLARAYESMESGHPEDERILYLGSLLKLEQISREEVDKYLLARALYAENLENDLWSRISPIVEKAAKEHPELFPEPEIDYLYEDAEDGMAAPMAIAGGAEEMVYEAAMSAPAESAETEPAYSKGMSASDMANLDAPDDGTADLNGMPQPYTAEYNEIKENPFKSVTASPLSTFSIDVDTAGYTKLKYDILDGYEIEKDEVKIEELINYFNYDYSGDRVENEPFTVSTEYTLCPWNNKHGLIRIGIQADDVQEKPATNFVLVTDVSGSMMLINKLPLALSAYADMLEGFDEKDTISLMYYAAGQGVILENVSCDKKEEIYKGLAEALTRAGGGTYGSLGLQTAYEMAEKSYIENGVNRILIATDGDFNIGVTSEGALKEIVEAGRQKGVYLTILGYGSENLKDNKMEVMAENGNGNYHYIGDMTDARKALVQESASTLIPMADDVKIQVEFNPSLVQEYRLIGYESRILNAEDFNNDKVDAGDVGAGKSVTALYEVVPAGEENVTDTPDLKYSKTEAAGDTDDLCTVSIRYKDINSGKTGSESRLVEKPVLAADYHEIPDANTALAISLAEAGMTIRDSEYKGTATLTSAEAIAKAVAAETGNDLALSWADLLRTLISQSE